MKVVIAEKPSVAKDIAKELGCNNREDGFFQGNGYAVTWAYGHLIELEPIQNYAPLNIHTLPIIPGTIHLKVKDDSGVKKQLKIIKHLFESSTSIINATDSGREGELIFRYIYAFLKSDKSVERLWISSLTKEAIQKGFKNLKPSSDYDNLYLGAKARSEADWLIGLNGSIGLSKANNSGDLLSVGRVQTATLSIIVIRTLQHLSFKPLPYFTLDLKSVMENIEFDVDVSKSFKTKEKATGMLGQIPKELRILSVETKEVTEAPPKLFDLTALQIRANTIYGISASNTLKITQALYERHKVVSYPRTDSNYLPTDMKSEVENTFVSLNKNRTIESEINIQTLNQKPYNNSKITDHHAIIPTGKTSLNLSDTESLVYTLIVTQFYLAFGENCIKSVTKVTYEKVSDSFNLSTSGTIINKLGYRIFKGGGSLKENEDQGILPTLKEGMLIELTKKKIVERKTIAPPLLTESTLLKLMETSGQLIKNEEDYSDDDTHLVEALKGKGIGTPSTRASMIEKLLSRKYIERKSKKIIPTKLGLTLISKLKAVPLVSPKLTGEWEYKISLIEKGELSYQNFRNEIDEFTKKITGQLISIGKELNYSSQSDLLLCPKCNKGRIRKGKAVHYCSNSVGQDAKCDLRLPIQLNKTGLKQIVTNGKTLKKVKGFKSKKTGKPFEAFLSLDKDFKLEFSF